MLKHLPTTYKPKGKAREQLAYISAIEAELLKALTDGRSDMTRHGVPSFADDSARNYNSGYGGASPGRSNNTTSNNGPQNRNNPSSPPTRSYNSPTRANNTTSNNGPQNQNNPSAPPSRSSNNSPSNSNRPAAPDVNNRPGGRATDVGKGYYSPAGRTVNDVNNRAGGLGGTPQTQNLMQRTQEKAYQNRLATQHQQYRSPNDYQGEDLTKIGYMADQYKQYRSPPRSLDKAAGQPYGIKTPTKPTPVMGSGEYLTNRVVGDVEDLRRPDLGNPDMQTGDWTYDPLTGVKTPVYNGLQAGQIPKPRVNPLKKSPVMRTPRGDIPMWTERPGYVAPTNPDALAMERAMKLAAYNQGDLVQANQGLAGRKLTKNHPEGNAIDIQLNDPLTGKKLGNYQNKETFKDYERYAQGVRKQQQAMNPELDDKMRWGGYFGGPWRQDQMHFDVTPSARGKTAMGNWDDGAGKVMKMMGYNGLGPNQPPSAYETAINNIGPRPTIQQADNQPAPQGNIPTPRPKPPQGNIPTPRPKPFNPQGNIPVPQPKPLQQTVSYNPAVAPPTPQVSRPPVQQPAPTPQVSRPPVADTGPSMWESLKETAQAGYQQYTDANKKINDYGGGEKVQKLGKFMQALGGDGNPTPDMNAVRNAKGGGGTGGMIPAGGIDNPGSGGGNGGAPKVVQQTPQFTWVQWAPGQPPTQIPTQALQSGKPPKVVAQGPEYSWVQWAPGQPPAQVPNTVIASIKPGKNGLSKLPKHGVA